MPTPFHFLAPAGIGDLSWVYSKICHIHRTTGELTTLYFPADLPRAIRLCDHLPGMVNGGNIVYPPICQWGGPPDGVTIDHLRERCRAGEKPLVAANYHLECGRKLAEWMPEFPCDYHYPILVSDADRGEAWGILREARARARRVVIVYVSGRHNDITYWNLWKDAEWVAFLQRLSGFETFQDTCFVFLGAEYDRAKTEAVAAGLPQGRVIRVIDRPLGVALSVLEGADWCVSFPSGIGIMANVLRTPCLMFLPDSPLRELKDTYADPEDIAAGRYANLVQPSVAGALEWLDTTGIPAMRSAWQSRTTGLRHR